MVLALASAVFLGSESLGTRDHTLLSQTRNFLFVAFYDSQGHGGGNRRRLHTGGSQFPFPYSLIFSRHGPPTENTDLLLLSVDHTEKSQVIAISPVHWRTDCCLTTSYKHSSYCCVRISQGAYRDVAGNALTCQNIKSMFLQFVLKRVIMYEKTDTNISITIISFSKFRFVGLAERT
jgi:hypothetical protein